MPAVVDANECTGCGACAEVCPVECITVGEVATVTVEDCTDCGTCVDECPVDCIKLS